ncbi:MAG: polysaccharide deacetylase family protein, partial [Burkholderiales bacterium]
RHPWTISSRVARREVRDGEAAIADILGQAPRFFRPPHGRMRRCMREQAESSGQAVILWNRSAIDWGPLGNSEAIAARLSRTRAGDIVLMHDGGRGINRPDQRVIALPAYLDDLGRRGLPPVLLQ